MDAIKVGETVVRMALDDGLLRGEIDFENAFKAYKDGKPDIAMAMLITMNDILPLNPKSRKAVYLRELARYGEAGPLTSMKIALENWWEVEEYDLAIEKFVPYMSERSASLLLSHPSLDMLRNLALELPYPAITREINSKYDLTNGLMFPPKMGDVAMSEDNEGFEIQLESETSTFKMGEPPLIEVLSFSQEIALSSILMREGKVVGNDNPRLGALWDVVGSGERIALFANHGDWEHDSLNLGKDDLESWGDSGETPNKDKLYFVMAWIKADSIQYYLPTRIEPIFSVFNSELGVQYTSRVARKYALKCVNYHTLWKLLPALIDLQPEILAYTELDHF